jgi:hypothetical protein
MAILPTAVGASLGRDMGWYYRRPPAIRGVLRPSADYPHQADRTVRRGLRHPRQAFHFVALFGPYSGLTGSDLGWFSASGRAFVTAG